MRSPAGILVRNDVFGLGHFGASRKRNGKQATHVGVDLAAAPGSYIHAPFDCTVNRTGICYSDDQSFQLIELIGRGQTHRILYVDLAVITGNTLREGDVIGLAQDLRTKYGDNMTTHIHWEILIRGIEDKTIPASSNYMINIYVDPLAILGIK